MYLTLSSFILFSSFLSSTSPSRRFYHEGEAEGDEEGRKNRGGVLACWVLAVSLFPDWLWLLVNMFRGFPKGESFAPCVFEALGGLLPVRPTSQVYPPVLRWWLLSTWRRCRRGDKYNVVFSYICVFFRILFFYDLILQCPKDNRKGIPPNCFLQ